MDNANLYQLFKERFPATPNCVFLEQVNGRQLLYDEIHSRTGRLLNRLRRLGVGQGDRVLVQVEKSIEVVLLYLACLRAGAIYVPLNTAYTAAEVAYFVTDASPRLFVCTPQRQPQLTEVAAACGMARVVSLGEQGNGELIDGLSSEAETDDVAVLHGDELAAILYTSGTPGFPRVQCSAMVTW